MQPLLLLLAFLLAHEAGTEDIIGGHEAKPHSHPYKALVQFLLKDQKNRCSSVLLRKDFVLTAAHCWGSPIMVTLGTHNIQEQERTQQVIPVREAICHPDYNPKNFVNDIMLLKLERKAKQTAAVWPLSLPRGTAQVWPGQVCSVAGLEARFNGHFSNHSAEVELTMQNDQECEFLFHGYYSRATQICVGDLKMMKNSFKGDSWGPLICENMAQSICSYGQKNGTPPAVFMKVSHYLPWIKRTMKCFSQQVSC
ncbi:granzyme H-like isoform X1 [Equus caballus]|uniref:granzyme H-like isoform X1 n=1 Tax=Equus caballus TaxID=9796 RepID=UPI0038B29264